ncbi:hypothetical protein R3W88_016789 [Solanum pinnatisectum]|uniref:Mitochondrial inner membrane protease subunit 2 n=1 Tax=Solanum pinnatisectum TaxID=50273 RepID=A0AAV9KYB6_9SOLN|nr:hypothetical protein R3W88_016789 [Solanum pinnatisectum]
MFPTFNPHDDSDFVIVEKLCLQKYNFSHSDVVVFSSPTNHKEKNIKRITALPGDVGSTSYYDAVVIPEGHCWVEGDNQAWSLDSRFFGPIPLGVVRGKVTHVVWPPQRVAKVERITLKSLTPF